LKADSMGSMQRIRCPLINRDLGGGRDSEEEEGVLH